MQGRGRCRGRQRPRVSGQGQSCCTGREGRPGSSYSTALYRDSTKRRGCNNTRVCTYMPNYTHRLPCGNRCFTLLSDTVPCVELSRGYCCCCCYCCRYSWGIQRRDEVRVTRSVNKTSRPTFLARHAERFN